MVINSTNINKTNHHLSPRESLSSDVNNSPNIWITNHHLSPKVSLKSHGQQFHQYQDSQSSPLT
jgi:hypothetical protein